MPSSAITAMFLLNPELACFLATRPTEKEVEEYLEKQKTYDEFFKNQYVDDTPYKLLELSAIWRPLPIRTFTTHLSGEKDVRSHSNGTVMFDLWRSFMFDIHHPTSKFIKIGGTPYRMSWFTESEPLVCPSTHWLSIKFPTGTTFKWSPIPEALFPHLCGAKLETSIYLTYASNMLCQTFHPYHGPTYNDDTDFGDNITQEQLDENDRELDRLVKIRDQRSKVVEKNEDKPHPTICDPAPTG